MIPRLPLSRKIITSALLLGLSCGLGAADLPRWRGAEVSGISQEAGWQTQWPEAGPKVLWKASLGTGFSTITVSGGKAYSMGNKAGAGNVESDFVYCFDALNGKLLWQQSYAERLAPQNFEGGPGASPTIDGNRVFTFSRSGKLYCFDAATGEVLWSNDLPKTTGAIPPEWGCASSPFIAGDLVIVNLGKAGTAVDKATGKVVWTTGKEMSAYSSAVPFEQSGKPAVLLIGEKNLHAVQVADGKILWSYARATFRGMNIADPVIVSPTEIFLASGYGYGCELVKIVDGKPVAVWENRNMRNHFNSSVHWEGFVYGFDENNLRCLDVQTGEVKWSERVLGKGSLAMVDGKLLLLSETGELLVAPPTPAGFSPIARAKILSGKCWTTPALANGLIYARNAPGDLVCLDVRGN